MNLILRACSKGGRRKGGLSSVRLTRPIICVCNDAYAPALRPLRAVAKVIHFHAPHPGRLYKRLSEVRC